MKKLKLFTLALVAGSMMMTSCKEEAPSAGFDAPSGTLYATKDIKFTNTSDGKNIDSKWTFEDAENTSSTSDNGTAVWDKPGTYNVTLEVSNEGGSDEASKTVTIEEYVPYMTIANNTPGTVWVTIGTKGLQNGESEWNWLIWDKDDNKNFVIVESGTTVDLKLWDEDEDEVDISGKDELYIAMFSGNHLYSIDAKNGRQPLVWHDEGLSKYDMDSKVSIDVSSDFFYVTIDNQGYSNLSNFTAFMGEKITDDVVGLAKKTVDMDDMSEIGYFDAYDGVQLGAYYTNSNYIFWQNFDDKFGENCEITFKNTDYKTTGLKNQMIVTTNSNDLVSKGFAVCNTPRKSTNVDVDSFEAFKQSLK